MSQSSKWRIQNFSFSPTNSPEPKDTSCTVINDEEKQQIDKSLLEKWRKRLAIILNFFLNCLIWQGQYMYMYVTSK